MASQLSAIEILDLGDEGREKPLLNKYFPEVVGSALGFGAASFVNFQTRRPVFSGIQKHVLAVVGFVTVLSYVQKKRDDYLAEKDAVLRHYVQLHPEDFPTPERRKIGDIFEPWVPIR